MNRASIGASSKSVNLYVIDFFCLLPGARSKVPGNVGAAGFTAGGARIKTNSRPKRRQNASVQTMKGKVWAGSLAPVEPVKARRTYVVALGGSPRVIAALFGYSSLVHRVPPLRS